MNYDEIRAKYFEIIYDERDLIEDFLKKQSDIRYGTQKDEWALSPMPELRLFKGGTARIHYIKLDENDFVLFLGLDGKEYRCYDFYYGELEEIIKQLPDPEELNRKNAVTDLKMLTNECSLVFEDNEKFSWTDGSIKYTICDIMNDGKLSFDVSVEDKAESFGIWEDLPNDVVIKFAEHTKKIVLHRSAEYKKLMELLSLEENLYFNLVEEGKPGNAAFDLRGTDCIFDVLDVSRDDSGNLKIFGKMWCEDDLLGEISLEEKDIRPEYLKRIIETIEEVRIPDIIDVYNAHDPELVKKINEAWRKDLNRFAPILKALYERDKNEFADTFGQEIEEGADILNYAHEIMEGVGDDWDLETILSFLRIK